MWEVSNMKSIYWNSLKAEIELDVLRCAALENLDEIAINGCDQEFLEWDRESDYQQLQHQINAFCNYEGASTDDLQLRYLSPFILPSKDGIQIL